MTLNYVSPEDMEPFEEGSKKAARKAKAAGKKARALRKIAQKGKGEVKVKGVTIDANAAKELTQAVQDRQDRADGKTAHPLDVLAQARKSAQVGKRAAKKGEAGVSVSMNKEVMATTAATKATPGSKAKVRITGASGRGEAKPKADYKPYQRRGGWGREDAPAKDTPTSNALDTAVAGGLKRAGKFVGKVVRGATSAVKSRADAEKASMQVSKAKAELRSKIRGAEGGERAHLVTKLNKLKRGDTSRNLTAEQAAKIRNIGRTKGDVSSTKLGVGVPKPDAAMQAATGVKVGVIKRGDAPAAKRAEPGPMAGRADGGSGSSRADTSSKTSTAQLAPPQEKKKPAAPKTTTSASPQDKPQPGMEAATGVSKSKPKKPKPGMAAATGVKAESLKAMLKAICQQKRPQPSSCASINGGGLTDKQREIMAAISKRKPAKFKGDRPKTANIAQGNATAPANLPKSFVGKSGQHRPGKNNDGTEAREQRADAPKPKK